MKRWLFLCAFFCASLVCCAGSVSAAEGLVINEVMYDPLGTDTNREWVEIYNAGTTSIDLAGHFFLSDGVSSSHHTLVAQGANVVPAGSYAVIVQDPAAFKADYPAYSGLIFDSSWSGLTATVGKTLAVIDNAGTVLDQTTYDPSIGATNDGNSLQKIAGGTWVAALPTPGAINAQASVTSTDTTTADTSSGGQTNTASGGSETSSAGSAVPLAKLQTPVSRKMEAILTIPKTATTGIPITLSGTVNGIFGEKRGYGITHFALGDGSEHDGKATETFTYTYAYPGTYIVTLAYRSYQTPTDAEVVQKATIVVDDPAVTISRVLPDGSIELTNAADADADLSEWTLGLADSKNAPLFHIPKGTSITKGGSSIFPVSVTHIPFGNSPLSLMLPSGSTVFTYGAIPAVPPASPKVVLASVENTPAPLMQRASPPQAVALKEINSETSEHPTTAEKGKSVLPFAVCLGLIIIGSGAALYKLKIIERKQKNPVFENPIDPDDGEPSVETIRILEE